MLQSNWGDFGHASL